MNNFGNQTHLKNVLGCIEDIENYCADLSHEEMQDEEFRKLVYRRLCKLGAEAGRVNVDHSSVFTLKSFENADYNNDDLGKDPYAILNFIINDLDYIKNDIKKLYSQVVKESKSKYAMA